MTEERPRFFTPTWFAALFRGEHSMGDTFWGGAFGVQLIFIPVWAAAEVLIQVIAPSLEPAVFLASNLLFLVYSLVLTRAVFIVARRSVSSGGWRWAAVVYCLISAAVFAKLTLSAIGEISA